MMVMAGDLPLFSIIGLGPPLFVLMDVGHPQLEMHQL